MKTFDVATAVGAVTREVRTTEREGKPAHVVVASRIYETDIDDTWDAVTRAERIDRWFTPIAGDLRLGGRYQLQGNAGGTITACEPPRHLAATWEFGGKVTWLNQGQAPHDATADDDSFATGTIEPGKLKAETFKELGTFSYICTIHPQMTATIGVAG